MKKIVLLTGLLLLACSCQPKKVTAEIQLSGTYAGVSPCTHCRGVLVKVTFDADGTAKLYSSADQPNPDQIGKWSMNDRLISVVTGRDTLYYRQITRQQIRAVYRDRQSSSFTDSYTLTALP